MPLSSTEKVQAMMPDMFYPAVRHDNDALTYPQSMPRIPWPSWNAVRRYFKGTGTTDNSPNYGENMAETGDGEYAV